MQTASQIRRYAAALLAAAVCLAWPVAARAAGKRMTAASSVRLRSAPTTSAPVVDTLSIGVLLDELGRSDAPQKINGQDDYWYRVTTPAGKQGWVFGGLTRAVDPNRLDEAYLEIARDRLDNGIEELSFADWTDFVAFLKRVAPSVGSRDARGGLELIRLAATADALASIPLDKQNAAPYKAWRDSLGGAVVYNEIGAQWFVDADEYWKLQAKYADTAVGERIAWDASQAPVPGECEGDVACHIAAFNVSTGRYLKLYPSGEHADDGLREIVDLLKDATAGGESPYELPTEAQYKAELRKDLAETRAIVSNASGAQRAEALALIDRVGEKLK